tara:strand:+ start:145 stop:384 length:240 start_codon:yes stop_codon:yes gene_type:complete
MPIYEYKCRLCGFSFEIMQKVDEKPPHCNNIVVSGSLERRCDGKCKKLISKGSFSLKGRGWYQDGYVKPNKSDNNDNKQ